MMIISVFEVNLIVCGIIIWLMLVNFG